MDGHCVQSEPGFSSEKKQPSSSACHHSNLWLNRVVFVCKKADLLTWSLSVAEQRAPRISPMLLFYKA